MKSRTVTLFLSVSILGATAWSQTPVPVGEDFQINSYTTDQQQYSSVAVDTSGAFVVVWESRGSSGTDTDGFSVQGQRFDPAGMPVGGEFQVNTYTTNSQDTRLASSVSGSGDGRFVVVWGSNGSYGTDTDGYSVQGRRFNPAGMPVGGQFQINTFTTNSQILASVAVEADGDFIVVWSSAGSSGSDSSNFSIQGQLFDAAGVAVGGEFQINTFTPNKQLVPSVAVWPKGDFVVVWESIGSGGTDTSSYSIQGQRFNAAGMPVGVEFQVNTYTISDQRFPSVAVDPDGDFVVVWESNRITGVDTSLKSVQGQLYDAAGLPVGGEFQINTYTTSHQRYASVAVEANGDFAVTWESIGSSGTDTSNTSIQGQRFGAAGMPVGEEFQVNSYTTQFQIFPSLAVRAEGDFVVVWVSQRSSDTDTSDFSIQGRRLVTPIFTDGFESGDTSAWSGVQ